MVFPVVGNRQQFTLFIYPHLIPSMQEDVAVIIGKLIRENPKVVTRLGDDGANE